MIKATYTMDTETVKMLDRLARRWQTSKSDALRRAIRTAAAENSDGDERLAALDRLQSSLGLTEAAAEAWTRHARAERRASSRRRGV